MLPYLLCSQTRLDAHTEIHRGPCSLSPFHLLQNLLHHSQQGKVALEAAVIAPAQCQRGNCHYHQAYHHVHPTPAHNHTIRGASLPPDNHIIPAGSCPKAHHAHSKNFHLHSRIYIWLRPICFSPLCMKNLSLNGYKEELFNISLPKSPLVLYNWAAVQLHSSPGVVNLFSNTIRWLYHRGKRF